MLFFPLPLPGAMRVEIDCLEDERGFFARTWCAEEFAAHGLCDTLVQCSISYNLRAGTLRGMHYQVAPHGEAKLVRCTSGALFDVILDLRPESPTFGHWHGEHLDARNRNAIYVPPGCAHGFQTIDDYSEILYQMSHPFHAPSARGVRWDDPAFSIRWPEPAIERVISPRDLAYPDFPR